MPYKKLCPFCVQNNLLQANILYDDELWYITDVIDDGAKNDLMAITKRHVETPFEINDDEWLRLHKLLQEMKNIIDKREQPDGYNIGWNVYKTGGQNVAHAHMHLMARYADEPLAGKGIRYAVKQPENKRITSG